MEEKIVLIGAGSSSNRILKAIKNEKVDKFFFDTDVSDIDFCEAKIPIQLFSDTKKEKEYWDSIKFDILKLLESYNMYILVSPLGGKTSCSVTEQLVNILLENDESKKALYKIEHMKSLKVLYSIPFQFEDNDKFDRAYETIGKILNRCETINIGKVIVNEYYRLTYNELWRKQDELFINEINNYLYQKYNLVNMV